MYTLRTMYLDNTYTNISLGKIYTVTNREESYNAFRELYFEVFGEQHVADLDSEASDVSRSCAGVVNVGGAMYPFYKTNSTHILNNEGEIFEILT